MLRKIWLLVLVSISFFGQSQSLVPLESSIEHDDEFVESWKVVITPGASEVKKAFKDFIKKRYDVKMKGIGMFSNKDVMTAKDVIITTISSKRVNFHVSVVDIDGLTELEIFGNYGESTFFDKVTLKTEYIALKTILVNFMNSYLPKYYQNRVINSQEKYDKFVKTANKLEKNISKNKKKIENLQREIVELQRDSENNAVQVKQSKKNVEKTKVQFDELKIKLSEAK